MSSINNNLQNEKLTNSYNIAKFVKQFKKLLQLNYT